MALHTSAVICASLDADIVVLPMVDYVGSPVSIAFGSVICSAKYPMGLETTFGITSAGYSACCRSGLNSRYFFASSSCAFFSLHVSELFQKLLSEAPLEIYR